MTAARWHALCLGATAASLCIGEGLALAGLAGLALFVIGRRHCVDGSVLVQPLLLPWLTGMGAFLICGMWATLQSPYGMTRVAEWGRWLPLGFFVVVPLSASALPRQALVRAAWCFGAAATAAALFGIVQYVADVRPLEMLSRAEFGRAGQSLVPGMVRSVAGGFFFHRLKLAHVLTFAVAGLSTYALTGQRRAWAWAALPVCTTALLLTFARGAWLAGATGVGMVALPHLRRRATALWLLPVLAAVIALTPVRSRMLSIASNQASVTRTPIWREAVHVLSDHPQGIGLGNYPRVIAAYYDAASPQDPPRTYPHNILLAAWAEAGAAGLGAFVLAHVALLLALYRRAHRAPVARFGLACMVVYVCLGLTHDVLYHNAVACTLCAAVAWSVSMLGARRDA